MQALSCPRTAPHAALVARRARAAGSRRALQVFAKRAPPPAEWATKPPQVLHEEVLGRVERSGAPLWSTFAGAAGGVWTGSMLAASPFTGALEPLALDAEGKPSVISAWTRRASQRVSLGADGALHDTLYWSPSGVAAAPGEAGSYERHSSSALQALSPGLVFFEDGSFSSGPAALEPSAEGASGADQEGEEGRVAGCIDIESCLCVNATERVRIIHTLQLRRAADVLRLKFAADAAADGQMSADEALAELVDAGASLDGEDLLLQQLRVRVSYERWAGPLAAPRGEAADGEEEEGERSVAPAPAVGAAGAKPGAIAAQPLAARPRAKAASLAAGEWTAFVRAATPVPQESDPAGAVFAAPALDAPPPRFAFEAYELRRTTALPRGRPYPSGEDEDEDDENDAAFDPQAGPPTRRDDEEDEEGDDDEEDEDGEVGSSLWLPGGVIATCELGTGAQGDGLTVSAAWLLPSGPEGAHSVIEREYDGGGCLREVRYMTVTRPGAQGRSGQ